MFGYILANCDKLTEQENADLRAYYCGLCEAIKKRHGQIPRLTLSYDMTFLGLFLSSLYGDQPQARPGRCPGHPFKPHNYYQNKYLDYAADMNILLSYYDLLDDWQDDKNLWSGSQACLLKRRFKKLAAQYPQKQQTIQKILQELAIMETNNELNPDLPANCFGPLMGEVFAYQDDEYHDRLFNFGCALGKFIYIMDACLDLKEDIQKERYNPLVAFPSEQFETILNLLMAQCVSAYRQLNLPGNTILIENILYSGVWTKYAAIKKKETTQQ